MNEKNYIMLKQRSWAKRNVKRDDFVKDYPDYLRDFNRNLFQQLSEINIKSFKDGDGNELPNDENQLGNMQAIYSSSALAVNLFQYWQGEDGKHIPSLVRALMPDGLLPETVKTTSFTSIGFEEKFKISDDEDSFPIAPNIDAVIHSKAYDIAVESKFTEPYRSKDSKKQGLAEAYIKHPDISDLWKALPALHELAKEISPCDNKFSYLHAAQLIRHILGLKKNAGTRGFCLLYLWYDVFGKKGARHRAEIEQFAKIAKADGIQFTHTTYQEVIVRLAKKCYEGNEAYCDYMIDRYL